MKTAGDIVKDKQYEIVCVTHDQTILQACQLMVDNKLVCFQLVMYFGPTCLKKKRNSKN
jgi:hypothetical protein